MNEILDKILPHEASAEFFLIFRSLFVQWSFKKKCFWDLLTFSICWRLKRMSKFLQGTVKMPEMRPGLIFKWIDFFLNFYKKLKAYMGISLVWNALKYKPKIHWVNSYRVRVDCQECGQD